MAYEGKIEAFFFDVFGTCVDWRSTVTKGLESAAHEALNDVTKSIASRVRLAVDGLDWSKFAQDWRNTYKVFTKKIASDPSVPYRTVDEHHHAALKDLIKQYEIEGLWSDQEVGNLSLIWHYLDPWEDSVAGMDMLGRLGVTATLSNGNRELLNDLRQHSKIRFQRIISAEMYNSYKPSPSVYQGAAKDVGVELKHCAMVAAHLVDLLAAKDAGYGTALYVERPREEDMSAEQIEEVRRSGKIDVWIKEGDEGFIALAGKLGIPVTSPVHVADPGESA